MQVVVVVRINAGRVYTVTIENVDSITVNEDQELLLHESGGAVFQEFPKWENFEVTS